MLTFQYAGWREQSAYEFGFVLLNDQIILGKYEVCHKKIKSPVTMHELVKQTDKPNFLEARIPVKFQLNIE